MGIGYRILIGTLTFFVLMMVTASGVQVFYLDGASRNPLGPIPECLIIQWCECICSWSCCYGDVLAKGGTMPEQWEEAKKNIGKARAKTLKHFVVHMLPMTQNINKIIVAVNDAYSNVLIPALDRGTNPKQPPEFNLSGFKNFLQARETPTTVNPRYGSPISIKKHKQVEKMSKFFGQTGQRYTELKRLEKFFFPGITSMSIKELTQLWNMMKAYNGALENEIGALQASTTRNRTQGFGYEGGDVSRDGSDAGSSESVPSQRGDPMKTFEGWFGGE